MGQTLQVERRPGEEKAGYGDIEAKIAGIDMTIHWGATQRSEVAYGSGVNVFIEFWSDYVMHGEGLAARAHTSSPQRESAYLSLIHI